MSIIITITARDKYGSKLHLFFIHICSTCGHNVFLNVIYEMETTTLNGI